MSAQGKLGIGQYKPMSDRARRISGGGHPGNQYRLRKPQQENFLPPTFPVYDTRPAQIFPPQQLPYPSGSTLTDWEYRTPGSQHMARQIVKPCIFFNVSATEGTDRMNQPLTGPDDTGGLSKGTAAGTVAATLRDTYLDPSSVTLHGRNMFSLAQAPDREDAFLRYPSVPYGTDTLYDYVVTDSARWNWHGGDVLFIMITDDTREYTGSTGTVLINDYYARDYSRFFSTSYSGFPARNALANYRTFSMVCFAIPRRWNGAIYTYWSGANGIQYAHEGTQGFTSAPGIDAQVASNSNFLSATWYKDSENWQNPLWWMSNVINPWITSVPSPGSLPGDVIL